MGAGRDQRLAGDVSRRLPGSDGATFRIDFEKEDPVARCERPAGGGRPNVR